MIPNATQLQTLSAAGKATPLLEHEANHSRPLRDSLKQPHIPTPGIKTKTHFCNSSVFLKKPKFQSYHHIRLAVVMVVSPEHGNTKKQSLCLNEGSSCLLPATRSTYVESGDLNSDPYTGIESTL